MSLYDDMVRADKLKQESEELARRARLERDDHTGCGLWLLVLVAFLLLAYLIIPPVKPSTSIPPAKRGDYGSQPYDPWPDVQTLWDGTFYLQPGVVYKVFSRNAEHNYVNYKFVSTSGEVGECNFTNGNPPIYTVKNSYINGAPIYFFKCVDRGWIQVGVFKADSYTITHTVAAQ